MVAIRPAHTGDPWIMGNTTGMAHDITVLSLFPFSSTK